MILATFVNQLCLYVKNLNLTLTLCVKTENEGELFCHGVVKLQVPIENDTSGDLFGISNL